MAWLCLLQQKIASVYHNRGPASFTWRAPRIKGISIWLKVNFVENAPNSAYSFVQVCYAMSRSFYA